MKKLDRTLTIRIDDSFLENLSDLSDWTGIKSRSELIRESVCWFWVDQADKYAESKWKGGITCDTESE